MNFLPKTPFWLGRLDVILLAFKAYGLVRKWLRVWANARS